MGIGAAHIREEASFHVGGVGLSYRPQGALVQLLVYRPPPTLGEKMAQAARNLVHLLPGGEAFGCVNCGHSIAPFGIQGTHLVSCQSMPRAAVIGDEVVVVSHEAFIHNALG